jgi:hypothetical protein
MSMNPPKRWVNLIKGFFRLSEYLGALEFTPASYRYVIISSANSQRQLSGRKTKAYSEPPLGRPPAKHRHETHLNAPHQK